jgi:hypothetical protein
MVRNAARPPSPSRRCSGTRLVDGHWTNKRDGDGRPVRRPNGATYDYERVWVEAAEEPCGMGASPWLPEVGYCAHHMPFEFMAVANARAELWALLCADIWEQVCAEHPFPGGAS